MDLLDSIGIWQESGDSAFNELHDKASSTATSLEAVTKRVELAVSWVDSIEARLSAMAKLPRVQFSPSLENFDLNGAPASSLSTPSMDGERAKGHGDDCDEVLGPQK